MLNIAKAAKSRNPPKASIPKHPNAGIPKLHKSLSELFPVPPKPPKFQPPPFPPAVRRDTEAVPKVIPQALLKQKMKQDNPTDLDDGLNVVFPVVSAFADTIHVCHNVITHVGFKASGANIAPKQQSAALFVQPCRAIFGAKAIGKAKVKPKAKTKAKAKP